jgi:flagellar basal body P-ring formation protein FlgA
MMTRFLTLLASLFLFAGAAFADPVTLRARVEASGPSITLGDVFVGAPTAIAGRAIAPAPAPGQTASLPASLIVAIAAAAGLDWTPPADLTELRVVRPGGMRATLPAPQPTEISAPQAMQSGAVIRRGDMVTVVFQQPGIELGMSGLRAAENGVLGQRIRFLNTSSNRTIEAVVTGPGAARAVAP